MLPRMTKLHISSRHRRAAVGTVAALVLGGFVAACGSGSNTTTATTAAPSAAAAQGARPALGQTVSGAAAAKARQAALAKYPGTVERVMQLANGSYVVHVL